MMVHMKFLAAKENKIYKIILKRKKENVVGSGKVNKKIN